MKIKFQNWVILMTSLLVVAMAAAFLLTVFRTFTTISENTASERFSLIATQAELKLENLIQENAKLVRVRAGALRDNYIQGGALNPYGMVLEFLGSVAVDPNVYSMFFGLDNEDFLQVIGVRGDKRLQEALQAPDGTYYAVRRIVHTSSNTRQDTYQFVAKNKTLLGSRSQEAKLVPTQRPWYQGAKSQAGTFVTAPYVFASNGELGITVASALEGGGGVLATDISLRALHDFLAAIELPPHGALAILDGAGHVISFVGKGEGFMGVDITPMTPANTLSHPALAMLKVPTPGSDTQILEQGPSGEKMVLTTKVIELNSRTQFQARVWAPLSDFTGAFEQAQRNVMLLSVGVLVVLLPLAFAGSRQIAKSLTAMARDSERLKRLDFSVEPHQNNSLLYEVNSLGEAQYVMHSAIQVRTTELKVAQDKLAQLVQTGIQLSREQDRSKLLRQALFGARDISHASAATLFLKTEHNTLAFAERTNDDPLPNFEIPLFDAQGQPNSKFVVVHAATTGQTVVIDDVYSETRFDLSGTKKFSEESGFKTISMLTIPLMPHEGEVIGVIQLLNAVDEKTGAVVPFAPDLVGFVEALGAQAAVAIENQNLIEAQKLLMDALIKLIAGAIDAKSPYTGGHCERVPELGLMLAEAATAQTTGPFASFKFETEDEWREFRIGAWLHDCGKVTTPEYVVDKAVKLETIYNRIHEVRTRFEVLLRDARISALEAVAAGADAAEQQAALEARQAQLVDDFEFIAECNLGGEFMAPEKIARLEQIAQTPWVRHFDDRAGLAEAELKRYTEAPAPLPAAETLLADKPHHVIARTSHEVADPKWGFKMNVPEHLYNYGEVYNLRIGRGTLTEEERFKINEHVMQSLMMLEQLPLPKNLKRVPEYAGTHHETLIGTGYPRKLGKENLTVPMRIMAIADIFEALTASDRPYKKAKTLSESIRILHFFKKDGHIDGDLFDLFLTSGIYQRYAERFLQPGQIDAVDIQQYLGR